MHPPNQNCFFSDPEPSGEDAAAGNSGEDEAPLFHLAPLTSFKDAERSSPAREDWDPETVKVWRWFVGNKLITVDARMKEDPARWHLEGLEPIYKTVEEAELQGELEKLGLLTLGEMI